METEVNSEMAYYSYAKSKKEKRLRKKVNFTQCHTKINLSKEKFVGLYALLLHELQNTEATKIELEQPYPLTHFHTTFRSI